MSDDLRYTFAKPIEIENIGTLYPCKIYEFWENRELFGILNATIKSILVQIPLKQKKERKEIKEKYKDFDVIMSSEEFRQQFIKLLSLCFKVDINNIRIFNYNNFPHISLSWNQSLYDEIEKGYNLLSFLKQGSKQFNDLKKILEEKSNELIKSTINRDNYNFIKEAIVRVNDIQLPEQSENPLIQKDIDRSERRKREKNGNIDLDDIITTIISLTGYTYKEIEQEMTMRQLNKLIARLNIVKNYDACINYICAGATDVKIKSYMEHIEDVNNQSSSSSFDDFYNNVAGKMKK